MRKRAAVIVACISVLVVAGMTTAQASVASNELTVNVTGAGSYEASAAKAVLADGAVAITCVATRRTHASAMSGKIAGGSHRAYPPVVVGTVAALSFRNCRTSHGVGVTEHAESLPYKVAIDSVTNSQGLTDGVIAGVRIQVAIPSTGCRFLVTGSAPGFFANNKRQFSATTKLPVRPLAGAGLTVAHATRCSGHIHNGDHPALTAAYAIGKKITIRSVIFAPRSADLAVANIVDNSTPNVGATVNFTVTVTNHGPDQATGVSVKDLLPSGLTFVSATPSTGSYDSTTGAWTVGTVTTSTPATLILTAVVNAGGVQTSTATISHSGQPDPTSADNTASVTISQRADLSVANIVDNSTPDVGATVNFTVTVTNHGPDQATGVSVKDLLPSGLTFVSATPSTGSYDSTTGAWTVGTVTTSTPATLILTAVVNAGGVQTSTATISHSGQPDPTNADNTASVTITAAVSTGLVGRDISYPQCGNTFPAGPAFGIVGVNGGLANDLNPCLGPSPSYQAYQLTELYWAESASTGVTPQPKASLYVNTADPGNVYNGTPIADWPTGGSTPYGTCTTTTVTTTSGTFTVGQNSPACAWQYGYNRGSQDASWLAAAAAAINAQSPPVQVPSGAGRYPWWLDVETVNTWQSGTSGQAMNVADLQGMIAGLTAAGAAEVGAYSTSTQWNQITGGTTTAAAGTLFGIPDWIPGAQNLSDAQSNCALPSFTGGKVTVTQWVAKGTDYDHAC